MKAKQNYYSDNNDIELQLQSEGKLNQLFELLSNQEKETLGISSAEEFSTMWSQMLESVGEYAGSQLAPNAAQVEKEDIKLEDGKVILPPTITQNIQTFIEMGGNALSVPFDFGGMNAPVLVELAGSEMVARACPSTLLNIGWYSHIANIIYMFGSEDVRNMFIPPIVSGEMSGSMALTEPDVGSDLANMRTYAESNEDGTWSITGAKQFISNGGGGISLVLAQNKKGANSLKTISLFVVPQFIDDKQNYLVTKIEEKPGLHGSATCAMQFEKSKGWLLGKDGEGFIYMLHLMNEARLAVGFQGLGLMEACIRLSEEYASQRQAWGKPIAQHEMICEKLMDMRAESSVFRGLLYKGAHYASMITMIEQRLKDKALGDEKTEILEKDLRRYRRKLREWTPLLKWWAGERSYEFARNSVQIHGGYGFTKEYQAEWWVRESLIISIYEGTSEIQALMCIKDTMKDVIRNPGKFVEILFATRMKSIAELDPLKRKYYKIKLTYLNSIVTLIIKLVKKNVRSNIKSEKKSDVLNLIKSLKVILTNFENISPAYLNASRICEMKSITALSRSALEDMNISEKHKEYASRFINRFYPSILKIRAELEWDDEQVTKACNPKDLSVANG